jgi:chromosomal replication initiator protein
MNHDDRNTFFSPDSRPEGSRSTGVGSYLDSTYQQQHEDPWLTIKERLKEVSTELDYQLWIEPLRQKVSGHNTMTLCVPNIVFYQGIMENFMHRIEECKKISGLDHLTILIELDGQPAPKQTEPLENLGPSGFCNQQSEQKSELSNGSFSRSLSRSNNQVDPRYTFETFVRGPSNQFAVATCFNVAENPGQTYNPLFIYGHTGLGKTHLLHAVGNKVLELNPNRVVTYIRSENFMNEMIYCIRHNKMWDFRQKYRHCDVFLVDDIQFISGKKATQEEFFHTFNSLYEAKKQIVFTSDLFPQNITDIEERLRNRFQWGLIADIQPPDVEHRIAILYNKAEKLGININDDVAEYICNHAKRNIRELEGALHRIHAFSTLHGRAIDIQLAMETFENVVGEPQRRITIDVVQKTVAEHFKIRVLDLKSKKRQRALTLPRQLAMFLCRQLTKSSFPEIGDKFGGKDHTTVMHAVKKIEAERKKDLDLKAHLESIERKLEQLN